MRSYRIGEKSPGWECVKVSAKLPYMRIYWADFFFDPMVVRMTPAQRGIYLLLLGQIWLKGGLISADDRAIARALDMDLRTWKRVYAPVIKPLLHHFEASFGGSFLTQKRLQSEMKKAGEALTNLQAGAARSRAKKAAKAAKQPQQSEPKSRPETKPENQSLKSAPVTVPDAAAIHHPKGLGLRVSMHRVFLLIALKSLVFLLPQSARTAARGWVDQS